jgi:hypothetical protein
VAAASLPVRHFLPHLSQLRRLRHAGFCRALVRLITAGRRPRTGGNFWCNRRLVGMLTLMGIKEIIGDWETAVQ